MQNVIITRSTLIEARIVSTPAALQKYVFDPNPEIDRNNILVYGIVGYSATQLAASPMSNRAAIPQADVPNIALTIQNAQGTSLIDRMPMYNTVRSLNGGFVVTFADLPMNVTRSFIELTGTGTLANTQSVIFEIYYKLRS